jgi:hypothetical protein
MPSPISPAVTVKLLHSRTRSSYSAVRTALGAGITMSATPLNWA